jgi:hypothetical protein
MIELPDCANVWLSARGSSQFAIYFVTRTKAGFLDLAYFVPLAMFAQSRRQNLPSFHLKSKLYEKLCFAGSVTVNGILSSQQSLLVRPPQDEHWVTSSLHSLQKVT